MQNVFIAAGGSGGHIYPGLAVAEALQKLDPSLRVHFVGTRIGLDQKILGPTEFPLHLIVGGKLNFSGQLLKKILTLIKLPIALAQSCYLLLRHRPRYVFGVGGFASGPMVLTAHFLRFRTGIWEPNAIPGMTNRHLSRLVDDCFIVFDEAKKFLPRKSFVRTGVLLRSQFVDAKFDRTFSESPLNILIIGGSQGSKALNESLSRFFLANAEFLKSRVRIVHQVGSTNESAYQMIYQGVREWVTATGFLDPIFKFYAAADLVISRSGAGSIAELACVGAPAILIPLRAANAHQEKNAEALVRKNAAVLISEKDLASEKFGETFRQLLTNPALRENLSHNISTFHVPRAAEQVASHIRQFLNDGRR